MDIDYSIIGMRAGIEVHQQLDTRTKLFCSCNPELFKEEPEVTFLRRLRPTQSELGQIDPAAYFEFQKGVKILYEAGRGTSCLVEMDEEPPHDLNREAVEICLIVALMIGARPVDEIHVMRKTVIDGSNTTGFQRTCVIALAGDVDIEGKRVPVQHVGLEEDAARKMGEESSMIRYRIDRLGIPLIEVTTAPVLYSPQEVEKAAIAIGRILRATGSVKRGLGTIRQDLNISIQDGAVIEIKGVQELELVSKVVEYEVQRQLNLLKTRDELKRREVSEEDIKEEFVDVSPVFKQTMCRMIQRALTQKKQVLALKLPKFAGLLKMELTPGIRLGSEMADIARFWGRVGGIFHTDELPAYSITREETSQLMRFMETGPQDTVVFVADTPENTEDALRAVAKRAREAIRGVPEETRVANPDGTTRYTRPRPGAARMYPETDVSPIQLTREYLEQLLGRIPELPEQKMKRLRRQYGLNLKLARQVLDSEYSNLFEEIVQETGVPSTLIAVVLTETMKALKREGVEVEKVSDEQIRELFRLIHAEKTAKEAIPDVITWLSNHKDATAKKAIESLGLTMISKEQLEKIIEKIIKENRSLIEERGQGALGPLMGKIMKKVRGRVKAELLSETLKGKLEDYTQ